MADITRDYPGDRKRRDIHANQIGTTCSECGGAVLRANVVPLKDGGAPARRALM